MPDIVDEATATKIINLQHKLFKDNVPVMILVEGFGRDAMGRIVNEVMHAFEPRGVEYTHFSMGKDHKDSVIRFLEATPKNGKIMIDDKGWYTAASEAVSTGFMSYDDALKMVTDFERYIAENGTFLIKVFLDFELDGSKDDDPWDDGNGKVSNVFADAKLDRKFREDVNEVMSRMLTDSKTQYAPLIRLTVDSIESTAKNMIHAIVDRMEHLMQYPFNEGESVTEERYPNPRESEDMTITVDNYSKKMDSLMHEMSEMQSLLAKSQRSLVLVFEGWDASGKGGIIRRLTRSMNPRGYSVASVAAPNDEEREHNYMWRFAKHMPMNGRITIFDRSWYGRMLVEPIEGFCTEEEYRRASREINTIEYMLAKSGTIILKFWLDISKDEQLRRFNDRKGDPLRSWKLTDDDWRNRDKWDQYDEKVNQMMILTNTNHAPWTAVESEQKKYGRVKTFETIINKLKKELDIDK